MALRKNTRQELVIEFYIIERAILNNSSIVMWRPFNDSPSSFPGLTQILLMALQSCGPLQILIQT